MSAEDPTKRSATKEESTAEDFELAIKTEMQGQLGFKTNEKFMWQEHGSFDKIYHHAVAMGLDSDEAKDYANKLVEGIKEHKNILHNEAYDYAVFQLGKTAGGWASQFANARESARPNEWATEYADKCQGESDSSGYWEKYLDIFYKIKDIAPSASWAEAYAKQLAINDSNEFEDPKLFDQMHRRGCKYANALTGKIAEGKSAIFSEAYARTKTFSNMNPSDLWSEGYAYCAEKGINESSSLTLHGIGVEAHIFANEYERALKDGSSVSEALKSAEDYMHTVLDEEENRG